MHKAYQYRLEPTLPQRKQIAQFAGCGRWIWNELLKEQRRRYESKEKRMLPAEMCRFITQLRHAEGMDWLEDCHSQVLQQKTGDMEKGYQAAFKALKEGRTDVGFPQFKSKYKHFLTDMRLILILLINAMYFP